MRTAALSALEDCWLLVWREAKSGLIDLGDLELTERYRLLTRAAIIPPIECMAADTLRDTPEVQ